MHAQDQIRLPTPLGHFAYSRFLRLPLADRLSALPLVAAAADFDGSPAAWRRCACTLMCVSLDPFAHRASPLVVCSESS